jgi:hypothetical protein
MTDTASFVDATVRGVEDGTQLARVSEEQPFQLVVVMHSEQNGDRLAVPSHYDRPGRTLL